MTNREKELLSVASEVMEALRSNGLECALSGSLMLAVAGINKRRESNDIDIVVDSNLLYNQFQASECGDFRAYVISLVEPKCGKVIAISNELYPTVSFIHKGKTYESVITGITFKDSLNYAQITLGEYRVKLTEKIQLLSKNTGSSSTNHITITNTNIDGGEF
ncbi:MAG: hypothetical protein EOM50_20830 [Erysipelotrichia bacterium]|nr:hypothetical protein [Erysipelotrichia bacterium]